MDYCSSSPCFRGVECTNLNGGFVCGDCPVGYEGDGVDCAAVAPVSEQPRLDPCQPSPCHRGVKCVAVWEGHEAKFSCGVCPDGEYANRIT